MVEITNYEYLRYNSHKNIFKTIAFCSLFVLAGIYLNRAGGQYLSWIGYPMIIIAITVALVLTVKRIWWNYYRNPMNWNQFVWDKPKENKHGRHDTVWEHDIIAFERGWDEAQSGMDDVENTASNVYHGASKNIGDLAHKAEKGIHKATNSLSATPKAHAKLSEAFAPYN
jgi:hypothetical protein